MLCVATFLGNHGITYVLKTCVYIYIYMYVYTCVYIKYNIYIYVYNIYIYIYVYIYNIYILTMGCNSCNVPTYMASVYKIGGMTY